MVGDRGQKTGGGLESAMVTILIVGVVAYVGLDLIGISLWTVLMYLAAAAVVIIALLGAYGARLIGRGSDAEMKARGMAGQRSVDRLAAELEESGQGGVRERPEASGNSTVMSTGWVALDSLRTGDIPLVSRIEDWLGWGDDDDE